jgi:hypothetical protein
VHLYAFRSVSDPELFAVTSDPSAPRLPADKGPWKFWRFARAPEGIKGVDKAEVEAAMRPDGCRLYRGLDTATSP